MEVKRDDIVNSTMQALQQAENSSLLKRLVVVFRGEQAIDGGGVAREFFDLFCKTMFSSDYGLFRRVTGGKYWFCTDRRQPLIYFSLLGTFVGLALYNSVLLPIRFPRLLYKKLSGRKILLSDLVEIEEELVASFDTLRAMRDRGEDISDCGLDFSVVVASDDPNSTQYFLKPEGSNTIVTNQNLDEYIELYSNYLMVTAVKHQFGLFMRGFNRIATNHIFGIFVYDELDTLVSGNDSSNWDELKATARYIDGYTSKSKMIEWFWEIFQDLTDDQKRRLLKFTTGTDRTPVSGLSDVKLTIQRTGDPEKLPVAHTCFSILSLPDYPSKSLLKKNLVIAIENNEGFGLV